MSRPIQEFPDVQQALSRQVKKRVKALSMTRKEVVIAVEVLSRGKHKISLTKLWRIMNPDDKSVRASIVDAFWLDQVLGLTIQTRLKIWCERVKKCFTFSREKENDSQTEEILA